MTDAAVPETTLDTATLTKTASTAYQSALEVIGAVEPRIAAAHAAELADQRASLKLIASENYASPAVLLTMSTLPLRQVRRRHDRPSLLRGLPERRHRRVACRRARARAVRRAVRLRPAALRHRRQPRRLLGDPRHPRRGACAGEAGCEERQRPLRGRLGDRCAHELGNQRMLGMSLDAGGHLTHGFRPNISGKMFHQRSYGTDPETGLLDYDRVAAIGSRVQAAGADRRLLGVPASGRTSRRCARSPTRSARP